MGGTYADRPIDIDLLLYGDAVVEEDFDVPGTEGRKTAQYEYFVEYWEEGDDTNAGTGN